MPSSDQKPSKPNQKPPPPDPQGLRRGLIVWGLILMALMIWNAITLWPRVNPQVNIPYTTFIDQLHANNIAKVRISGAEITGKFIKPLLWPKPAPVSSKTKAAPTPRSKAFEPPSPAPAPHTEFRTIFPQEMGDPDLISQLEAHQVVIDVAPPSSGWGFQLLISWMPMILLIGFFWWMGQKATKGQAGLFNFARARARRYSSNQPQITFNDVAGVAEAKGELQEEVDFLCHPNKYHEVGAQIPRGILLIGPPGTGKTLLARAVAGEAGVPFFNLSASEFVEMFVGVGASRVRDLFVEAKKAAPSIIFIDELDAVGRRRGGGIGPSNSEREQTLNQLLVEMDGFDEKHEVIVLAATNRPDVLDPALLRPGRFDRRVVVGLPDRKDRQGILQIHTRKLRLAPDVDLSILARTTTGFSGADLANLCNEAALSATRHDRRQVAMVDFEEAQDKIVLGGARPSLLDPHDRQVVAYHESGHALVAWLTPTADPVSKVTIVPHGQALGVTEQLPSDDHYNYARSYLVARLAVMLGGRTAEEIALSDVTTGAENDLIQATRLARHMVTRWGMGKLGLVAFQTDGQPTAGGFDPLQGREYSQATAAVIDEEVRRLLEEQHQRVHDLLTNARDKLDRLVEALLREETVGREMLAEILGPRPQPAETRLSNP
jgi:cell division protease FtsH